MEINSILILLGYIVVVFFIVKGINSIIRHTAFAILLFLVLSSFPFWDIIKQNKFSFEEYKLVAFEEQINISVKKVTNILDNTIENAEQLTE